MIKCCCATKFWLRIERNQKNDENAQDLATKGSVETLIFLAFLYLKSYGYRSFCASNSIMSSERFGQKINFYFAINLELLFRHRNKI
jgi:hypothetical protein